MHPAVSPETLAAQALGEGGAASQGLVPPIHPATTYERAPDGTYPAGLAYTRADNPTYEPAEHLLTALEGGPTASCLPPATPRRPRSSSPCSRATTCS
jgi:O-acetylhomoserine/O-acetylserine sulfhydrylase-like pyridoxal-dependent enzyme